MPDTEVVGEATTGEEILTLAGSVPLDVILMDINMPGMNGIETTRRICETNPDIRILMVTMLEDGSVFAEMRAGARGYMVKSTGSAEVLRAIRAVADGEAIFSPAIAERLIHYFATPPAAIGDPPRTAAAPVFPASPNASAKC
jgi:DNA-binding NarL/FixJ family response regulator